jgi:hypothetical protein
VRAFPSPPSGGTVGEAIREAAPQRARLLLRARPAHGPQLGSDIEAEAEALNIPMRSLIVAADELGVRTPARAVVAAGLTCGHIADIRPDASDEVVGPHAITSCYFVAILVFAAGLQASVR